MLVLENETDLFGEIDEDVCLSTIDLSVLNEKSTNSLVASEVSTADAVCSSRFQALDQNGLDKILEDADSQRTKQTTKWAVAVFNGTYALSSVCKFMFLFLLVYNS